MSQFKLLGLGDQSVVGAFAVGLFPVSIVSGFFIAIGALDVAHTRHLEGD